MVEPRASASSVDVVPEAIRVKNYITFASIAVFIAVVTKLKSPGRA
jgi:hypothetical protein